MEKIHEHRGKSSESILDENLILKSLTILPGQHILDAGCGDGYMAKEFSKLAGPGGKVYAIDIYEQSINQLRNETATSNITAITGDVTKKTVIESASIDLVYLSTVFHGFTAPQKVGFLREMKRILRPGGILAVVEINKCDTPFGPPSDIRYSPEEIVEAIDLEPEMLTTIGDYFYMQTFTCSGD
jgi:ubiquinone/menaquinone biosynthesis C-methylase UbiE